MAEETTGTEVVDTGVEADSGTEENSGSDGVVNSTSASNAPIKGGQIDDPNGENFDYDRWAAEQGLRGEKPAKGKKDAKKDETNSDEEDSDFENSNDNEEEAQGSNNNKNDSDKEIEIKLKVNGEERSVKGLEEIQRLAQLGAASNEKFQEASAIKKDVQNLFEMLKTDPGKVFRHPNLGKVFKEAAEKYLYEELQLEMMPEDRREGELAKRRLAEYEQEREYEQKENEQVEQEKMKALYHQRFSDDIKATIEIGKLPNNPNTIKRIAGHIQSAIQNGQEMTFDQLAKAVRNDLLTEHKQLINSTQDVESLINIIGEENVNRIRQYKIGQMKNGSEPNPKVLNKNSDPGRGTNQTNNGSKVFRSANEMMDFMRG